MWTVSFKGFETEQQAQAFTNWYAKWGEQTSGDWISHHCDITDAMHVNDTVDAENKTINVELKLYKEE